MKTALHPDDLCWCVTGVTKLYPHYTAGSSSLSASLFHNPPTRKKRGKLLFETIVNSEDLFLFLKGVRHLTSCFGKMMEVNDDGSKFIDWNDGDINLELLGFL